MILSKATAEQFIGAWDMDGEGPERKFEAADILRRAIWATALRINRNEAGPRFTRRIEMLCTRAAVIIGFVSHPEAAITELESLETPGIDCEI